MIAYDASYHVSLGVGGVVHYIMGNGKSSEKSATEAEYTCVAEL
jgi:hypothetical protein